jgi:hypothetical protein
MQSPVKLQIRIEASRIYEELNQNHCYRFFAWFLGIAGLAKAISTNQPQLLIAIMPQGLLS